MQLFILHSHAKIFIADLFYGYTHKLSTYLLISLISLQKHLFALDLFGAQTQHRNY